MRCWRLVFGLILLVTAGRALAHPMGNFSISHHALISAEGDALLVRYRIDFAEIPASGELRAMDANHDGTYSEEERAAFLAGRGRELLAGLRISVDHVAAIAELAGSEVELRPGAADLPTMLVTFNLVVPVARGTGRMAVELEDGNFVERTGWSEMVAMDSAGWRVAATDAEREDKSAGLTAYPPNPTVAPPAQRAASVTFARREGVAVGTRPSDEGTTTRSGGVGGAGTPTDMFTRLIRPGPLSPGVILGALAVASVAGAFHALSPGHGKTVVAAYLIGARGTSGHAVLLGAIVTGTHVAAVFALGLGVLVAGNYFVPEAFYPWLGFASGAMILAVGAFQLSRRLAVVAGYSAGPRLDGHGPGGHTHAPPERITLPGLVALGVSGGLVPCPSALVVLLGAIALHRTAFGLVLVTAFSLGLAMTLTCIGLLMVHVRAFAMRHSFEVKWSRRAGLASAAGITLVGLALTVQAARLALAG